MRRLRFILLLAGFELVQTALGLSFFSKTLFAQSSDDILFLDFRYLPLEEDIAEGDDLSLRKL